jgi:hypothetical protein
MPLLSKWFRKAHPVVPPEEKEQLRAMQESSTRQQEEARGLLYEARLTGQKLAASRQRNHYRLILDDILGGKSS